MTKGYDQNNMEQEQELDDNGVPVDMVRAMDYLQERLYEYRDVSKSELLLARKKEEDEGVECDEDEEPFEDLLDDFGIDPEDVSLDLNENDKRRLLLENMDDKQLVRYEFFRRTNLNTGAVRKFVNAVIGQSINPDLAKIIGGVGKVFVGEIIEKAKDVQRRENEAKVIEQLNYKRELKRYEDEVAILEENGEDGEELEKPGPPPGFYEQLRSSTAPQVLPKAEYTFNSFQVIIPDATVPLTPDHIRTAWQKYCKENNTAINGRWRQQGGGSGLMFR